MKTPALLLIGSLLANGVLVLALTLDLPPAKPVPAPTIRADREAQSASAGMHQTKAVNTPVPGLWARLRTDNLDELSRRLRAAGFPAKEVRALLSMAIDEELASRREAILGKPEDTPYWKYPLQNSLDPERQSQRIEINREARALDYKYLSGPDALVDNEDAQIAAKRRFGNLSLEKLQQLTVLQHDLDDLRYQRATQMSGARPDEKTIRASNEAMQALEREHLAAVAKVLTPAELEQYELRNTAGGLRMSLANFRPTEEEFKALYAAEKTAAASWFPRNLMMAQTILTPERFEEYTATQTSDGRGKLGQLIARLDLPMTTITTVNAVRDDISARAKTVGADTSLSSADRNAILTALAQEAQLKLTSSLGDRGYRAYAELKGEWIRALKPKGQ